jgi:hypothetical protein
MACNTHRSDNFDVVSSRALPSLVPQNENLAICGLLGALVCAAWTSIRFSWLRRSEFLEESAIPITNEQ